MDINSLFMSAVLWIGYSSAKHSALHIFWCL